MTRTEKPGAPAETTPARTWERPQLKYVGHVGDVLQGGGGKLSPTGGDTGENKVEKPHA
jgi:hypothetical protein